MRCYSVDDNMIDIMYSRYGSEDTTHMHTVFELIYIIKGRGVQVVNGRHIEYKEKQALLLEPNATHSYIIYESTVCFSVMIGKSFITDGARALNDNTALFSYLMQDVGLWTEMADFSDDSDAIEDILFHMREEQKHKKRCWISKERAYATILLTEFLRNSVSLQSQKISMSDIVDAILKYVNENYYRQITLNEISKIYQVSPEYISSLMKKKCGLSFKEYLINRRLMKAINMILTTDMPIDDIAYECGFTNLTFFYKNFEKYFETTPKGVRNYLAEAKKGDKARSYNVFL